jgi:integrase
MEPNNTQNQDNQQAKTTDEAKPMLKEEARILTPKEYNRLRNGFKQAKHKLLFDAMLYTGMRIEEFWRLVEHPEWFDYNRMCIHLPRGSILKLECHQKERDVLLSSLGTRAVNDLLDAVKKGEIKHITSRGWNDDIVRAARRAGFKNLDGFIPKMARKTYISWLMAIIPDDGLRIAASSGHTPTTMIEDYMNTPFTQDERNEIKMHIQGWGGKSI